jgi:C-terminal processing protease CtpA/Prc
VGYIRVKSFALKHVEPDRKAISAFFEQSAGEFSKLIIDVRDNSGGRTEYFYENLMKPFLNQPVAYKHVTGLKRKFLEDHNQAYINGQRFTVSSLANETSVVEASPPPEFDSQEWVFYEITRELSPNNRYRFKGDIFVLINGNTGSAADDFANAMKRIGISILVGQNTSGSAAAYVAPIAIRLPESGMQFIMEVDLLINPDGSYNEIVGTSPDITLPFAEPPGTVTKEALLNDDWISKIISDL